MVKEIKLKAKKVRFAEQRDELVNYDIGELKYDHILIKAHRSLISVGTETTALTQRWDHH